MVISSIKFAGCQENFSQASFSTDSTRRFYKMQVKRIIRTQGTAWDRTPQDQMPTRNEVYREVKQVRKTSEFGGSVSSSKNTWRRESQNYLGWKKTCKSNHEPNTVMVQQQNILGTSVARQLWEASTKAAQNQMVTLKDGFELNEHLVRPQGKGFPHKWWQQLWWPGLSGAPE